MAGTIGGTTAAELTGEVGKLMLIHGLAKDVLGGLGLEGRQVSTDPEHKKDQLNELALTHFRILFAKANQRQAQILDKGFALMSEGDQVLFSLTILAGVSETARANGGTYDYTVSITSTPGSATGTESAKKTKTEVKTDKQVSLFDDANYRNIIRDLTKTIRQCEQDNEDEWVKHLLRRLDEDGWISGKAADKVVRWLKKPETKQWFQGFFQLNTSGLKKELNHQAKGLKLGTLQLTEMINNLRQKKEGE